MKSFDFCVGASEPGYQPRAGWVTFSGCHPSFARRRSCVYKAFFEMWPLLDGKPTICGFATWPDSKRMEFFVRRTGRGLRIGDPLKPHIAA